MIWTAAGRRGNLEAALPHEWALLLLIVALIAAVGGVILLSTYLRHEQVVVNRYHLRETRRR